MLFRNPDRYIADKGAESLDELFERTGQFLDGSFDSVRACKRKRYAL